MHQVAGPQGPAPSQEDRVKFRALCVLALLLAPGYTFAASKEIQELQRDVAQLQDQLKALQRSQDDKLIALTTLVQQAINSAQSANSSANQILGGFQSNQKDLENKVVTPVVGLSSRMDQMSGDFRMLQQSVSDLTSLLAKLQAQITDLGNSVKVMQAPAAAPPPAGGSVTPGPGNAAAEAPPIPATDLYNNAQRDRTSGKLDLAVQEFSDYLKWYGNTELAPNAQFYIAFIHYSQMDYDNAVKEFDAVLERYPDNNNKVPDALFYKGMSLTKMGRRTQGADEFKELLKRFPNHDLSRQACSQLTNLGLKCGSSRAAAPRGSRRRP
jgi:TolA-binding protein